MATDQDNTQGVAFRFVKQDSVGTAQAEFDDDFLAECFIDSGDLATLRDCQNPRRIIVGRTGSGKSALIKMLKATQTNVIELAPDNLALNYLANSEVIRFFESAGTNLDVFYQLLWRHVLCVELIKFKYKITNEVGQRNFLNSLTQLFVRDKAKEAAVAYLRKWGESFWNETEYRVKEVANKIEEELLVELEGGYLAAKAKAGGKQKLTDEEKVEVITRGARVVNKVQIKALGDVMRFLSEEIFTDPQDNYYITIDDLDTQWVEESLKFRLVRALIETVKSFRQVSTVKIVVSIRSDLLQRVIEATRDAGFQSEKYEALYLKIRWEAVDLIAMIQKRINRLVQQRYTSKRIGLSELFPKVGRVDFEDYLIQHTFLRPRDAILFVNECLERATGRYQVTAHIVYDAEAAYSDKRVDSLQEEWGGLFPKLSICMDALKKRPAKFKVGDLTLESLNDWIYQNLLDGRDAADPVVKAAEDFFLQDRGEYFSFQLALVDVLYTVGVLGVKPTTSTETYWSFYSDHSPMNAVKSTSVVQVHQTFWRALGIRLIN